VVNVVVEKAPVWLLATLVAILILGFIYGMNLDCKRSIFGLEFGTGDSCTPETQPVIPKPLEFSSRGVFVDEDGTDKTFLDVPNCPNGDIIAAKTGGQAAICTCLSAEAGRGWYCFN